MFLIYHNIDIYEIHRKIQEYAEPDQYVWRGSNKSYCEVQK